MKVLVALLAVCTLIPTEGKVLQMLDYHRLLDGMFIKSCAAIVPDHSGLHQLKKEIEQCYEDKKLPVPGELQLSGVPIGLENIFPDEYISASSSRDEDSGPERGRLNTIKDDKLNGAWCSEINNDMQHFQVDLGAVHGITGIVIQGDHKELNWVQSYTLEISNDGKHWGCVFGSDGRLKVFDGNVDSDTPVTAVMNPVIRTRYVRIVPKSWTNHICLRAEIYVEELLPREKDEPEPVLDFETEIIDVNPKRPKALIVKSFRGNQVDTGMVPEEWTDKRLTPIKSVSFEHSNDQPQLFQVRPALDTQVLGVNPKETVVVKNNGENQINTGVLPEEFTDRRKTPTKTISFESDRDQPDLLPVPEVGVVGSPLNPNDDNSLVIPSRGPVVDHVAPGILKLLELPQEVSTYDGDQPAYTLEYKWQIDKFKEGRHIEFAFGVPVHIRAISTTGTRGLAWVTHYMIMYLNPNLNKWVRLQDENMEDLRIPANNDDTSPRDHVYFPGIFTSRFRIYVLGSSVGPKTAMTITLKLADEPRKETQILTSPVFIGTRFGWTWENRGAAKGDTQELFFRDTLTLRDFTLESESLIESYRLQYLVAAGQWRDYADGETTIFPKGVRAEGLRIIVNSWEEGDTFFGQFSIKIEEDISDDDVILDIIELSSHYQYFKWEDSNPAAGSAASFSFEEEQELTRIETKGINGAWANQYQLECRAHYEQQGNIMVLAGNTNDEDTVEHLLNIACKYVFIRPTNDADGIGLGIYLYSDTEPTGATADIFEPGSIVGSFDGQWNPPNNGGEPYLEFIFDHHIMPTKITLDAMEGSSVQNFKLQKSDDGEHFENVMGTDNRIKLFPVGSSEFEVPIELRALRILPDVIREGDNGFKYGVEFVAEKQVQVSVNRFGGTPEAPVHPEYVLSANYNSPSSDAGQYVRVIFEKPELAHQFYMEKPVLGSTITKFNLLYKARPGDKYINIEKDGETDFPGNSEEISVDLGDLEVSEFKIVILASEGDGVKFQYGLQLSGNIGDHDVRNAFDDAQAANEA